LAFQDDEAWLQQYCSTIAKVQGDNGDLIYKQLNSKNNLGNTSSSPLDLLCVEAKTAYYAYDIPSAYDCCQKILTQNSMFFDIIPIYTACLVELERVSELYSCAHKLIDNYAHNALSWLAVGNYYYLTKKYEIARKHYQRAIQLDQNLVHAWIGLAHSYAI
jgi:anaphase-promoting complex subunit 6